MPIDASSQPFWVLVLFVGLPFVYLFGRPYGWRALVILAAVAGLALHPIIGIAIGVLYIFWVPIREFFLGLFTGLGLRASGAFNSPERAERLKQMFQNRRRRRFE
jgi:hypothetical protein